MDKYGTFPKGILLYMSNGLFGSNMTFSKKKLPCTDTHTAGHCNLIGPVGCFSENMLKFPEES